MSEFLAEAVVLSAAKPPRRHPNIGDVGINLALLLGGALGACLVIILAAVFHWFGVSDANPTKFDPALVIVFQTSWYFLYLAACFLVFPSVWHRSLFSVIEWNFDTAYRSRRMLAAVTLGCLALVIVAGLTLPAPKKSPLHDMFRTESAAWTLFVFGVSVAPFVEEFLFRGFLLPALCTGYDWISKRLTGLEPPAFGWSKGAVVTGSILVSIPFAFMHGQQTGYSVTAIVIIFSVSLILCAVRLRTNSLAASTFVHITYNLALFAAEVIHTGGFRHMEMS